MLWGGGQVCQRMGEGVGGVCRGAWSGEKKGIKANLIYFSYTCEMECHISCHAAVVYQSPAHREMKEQRSSTERERAGRVAKGIGWSSENNTESVPVVIKSVFCVGTAPRMQRTVPFRQCKWPLRCRQCTWCRHTNVWNFSWLLPEFNGSDWVVMDGTPDQC